MGRDLGDPRRIYGAHLTPRRVFHEYIAPMISGSPWSYVWVDMFAGRGDLILPLLETIPPRLRSSFFEEHVYLFDVQESMVEEAIKRAVELGIPRRVARRNIEVRDTLREYPSFLAELGRPVFHITNPPYMYLGYIRKHPAVHKYLEYFEGANRGLQDLYQVALVNDARHGIQRMIYVVPTNFLYGYSVSNKARMEILHRYTLRRAVVFEEEIFDTTGTHVALCFFELKERPGHGEQVFEAVKVKPGGAKMRRVYRLKPLYRYRAGAEFDEFVEKYRARNPLHVGFHLRLDRLLGMRGKRCLKALDTNSFDRRRGAYREIRLCIDEDAYRMVKANALFLRTLDTGRPDGRAGLYLVREVYGVDALVVTRNTYRTHPIHVVLRPTIGFDDQVLLKDYFNLLLEYLREQTDSDFMTTYKYSPRSPYTRKYLGLTQARRLMETFPILDLDEDDKGLLRDLVRRRDVKGVLRVVKRYSSRASDPSPREA